MRICFFLLLLACFGLAGFVIIPELAKAPPHVSGYVLDAVSGAPVPNVMVRVDGRGAKTDEKGHFFLLNSSSHPFRIGATAIVHTIYYGGSTIVKSENSIDKLTILLHRNRYRFRASACMLETDSVNINPYSEPLLFELLPGNQIGVLLRNTSSFAFDTVKTITLKGGNSAMGRGFYTDFGAQGWVPFRLRIYQIDSVGAAPGRDLLEENMILCFPAPDSVYTLDLREYKIVVPHKDIVVAIEPVVQGDQFYTCPEKLVRYKPKGLVLRAPCAFADARTWTYDYQHVGDKYIGAWRRLTKAENCWPLYESIFSVELSGKK